MALHKSYKDLKVWQEAYQLGLEIYKITQAFPQHELFGLTAQLRRCGISISSNIAEGYYRNSPNEFRRFLKLARGSCGEIETQLAFSKDLQYLNADIYEKLSNRADSISKMLFSLQNKL